MCYMKIYNSTLHCVQGLIKMRTIKWPKIREKKRRRQKLCTIREQKSSSKTDTKDIQKCVQNKHKIYLIFTKVSIGGTKVFFMEPPGFKIITMTCAMYDVCTKSAQIYFMQYILGKCCTFITLKTSKIV